MPLRRGQRAQGPSPDSAPGTGMLACPLCGEVVPVGDDGRCGLGHRVFTPPSASERTQPLPPPEEHGEPADAGDGPDEDGPDEDGPDEDGADEDGPPDVDLTRELDW